MRCDRVWRNARLATLAPGKPGIGEVEDGVVACRDGLIIFAGPARELSTDLDTDGEIDCDGRWITPGLIDCHTHLVYAGDRAQEFQMRLAGTSYEALARAGGGILSTMNATRAASEGQLVRSALPRLDALLAEGVTTVEIKSGYGLTLAHERKQLSAARGLALHRPVSVVTTFLGAHAVPPEYKDDPESYVTAVCEDMIPALVNERLVDAVDAFCEGIGFSYTQARRVLWAAKAHGLPIKLHAEQLSNLRGAALAAELGALSADHLEHVDEPAVLAHGARRHHGRAASRSVLLHA